MRVSELAGVAGVSVRTIRHYHAIGLMPVPPRTGAWRDYGVNDAARLLRIRALADAGIALSDMPAHLDGDAPLPDADGLDAAIASIDERIAELEEHRSRLARLRDAAVDGGPADALPRRLADIYNAIEVEIEATGNRRALTLMRRERRLSDIAARLGHINDDVVELLGHADPAEIADYYLGIAALADPGWTDTGARDLVDRGFAIVENYGELPPSLIPSLRFFAVNRPARALVISAYPAPGQRRFVELAFDRLASYLEEHSRDHL
ncbi:MerR family transcriptional regulator [Corynebacterium freneyi]|uniref:MerR family transcriptional regulator n=1 Tax=Corynebacterium freneyi TaxID=134034 RepID=UPI00254F8781|nr:MerR family transcriptional regulator [Corynebacterium freneyi]MDK8767945.1 MerR family transcriptional regulator [Corynebacterium freneyi]